MAINFKACFVIACRLVRRAFAADFARIRKRKLRAVLLRQPGDIAGTVFGRKWSRACASDSRRLRRPETRRAPVSRYRDARTRREAARPPCSMHPFAAALRDVDHRRFVFEQTHQFQTRRLPTLFGVVRAGPGLRHLRKPSRSEAGRLTELLRPITVPPVDEVDERIARRRARLQGIQPRLRRRRVDLPRCFAWR